MTRLPFADYLDHLEQDSARFGDVLAATDPQAPVPSCPDWDASDLLRHLTQVQRFWARIVRERPAAPQDEWREPPGPAAYDDLLAAFAKASADLAAALAAADPAEHAWTWSAEQTVGFTFRRQAHEALIHRLDAEQTAGDVTPLAPRLAADGVAEALGVMFGGTPPWGRFDGSPEHVRVDLPDTDTAIWVQLGTFTGTSPEGSTHEAVPDLDVVADPGTEPDAVVEGLAGDMDAWLWRRADDTGIRTVGDAAVLARFRACVNQPID